MKKIAAALLLLLALTACGADGYDDDRDKQNEQNEKNKELIEKQLEELSNSDENIHLQVVNLPGHQAVYCIIYGSNVITCDWDHKIDLED